MRVGVALALLALADPARGQSCVDAAGVGLAATYGHRDWDLATPAAVARGASPALSATCEGGGVWMGVDIAPGLRHSYGDLLSRGGIGFTAHMGFELWAGEVRVAPELFTNGATHGFGLRLRPESLPAELRLGVLPGRDPTLLAAVVIDLRRVRDPGDRDGLDLGWGDNPLRLRHGFEIGHFIGYRVELGERWRGPALGLRAGTLTHPRGEATVQPLAAGFVDVPLGPEGLTSAELALGWTRRKGEDQPVAGLRLVFDGGESPLQLYTGRMWGIGGERWWAADFGIAMLW